MNILSPYLAAGYPAVAVETHEEDRFILGLVQAESEVGEADRRPLYAVAAVGGLRKASLAADWSSLTWAPTDDSMAYGKALAFAALKLENCLLVLLDWHHIARNAPAYRALKDAFPGLKARGNCVLLVAPSWSLPVELEHDVPVIRFALPGREALGAALDVVTDSTSVDRVLGTDREAALDAAAGLTLQEAENAYALSFAVAGRVDPRRVEEEKMGLVRQSGYLEVTPPVPADSLGGLGALRAYLEEEVLPSWHDPLLRTKGILLVGIQGGGKSLAAKICGSLLQCPVLKCDIGSLKASHVGESEARMRAALALADAVAPCVLFMDEIEKGVGGFASSAQSDSGVTLGMVSTLLCWLQEHTSPVIVIATANDYAKLPPELTRAGRFDERWFVDLPTEEERAEIASIHLRRFDSVADDGSLASTIAGLSDGFTGAEIEQCIKSAARRTGRSITRESMAQAIGEARPISRVCAEEVTKLRKWGSANLRRANSAEVEAQTVRRRITTHA